MNNNTSTITSFAINKSITTSRLFSKIEISPSAKLVLRCIVDFWNFELGYAFPTQATIIDCTGLVENSVLSAIKELFSLNFIKIVKKNKRNYYIFTPKFWGCIKLFPDKLWIQTFQNGENIIDKFGRDNKTKEKENTRKKKFLNTSSQKIESDGFDDSEIYANETEEGNEELFSSPEFTEPLPENRMYGSSGGLEAKKIEEDKEEEEDTKDSGLAMAQAMIRHMSHHAALADKIKELKEKYNLDDNGEVRGEYIESG